MDSIDECIQRSYELQSLSEDTDGLESLTAVWKKDLKDGPATAFKLKIGKSRDQARPFDPRQCHSSGIRKLSKYRDIYIIEYGEQLSWYRCLHFWTP